MVRKALVLTAFVLATLTSGLAAASTQTAAPQTTSSKKTTPTAQSPINLNSATAAELEALPGVGPAMALRIVEYRQKNGGFKKLEDLMHVKGVGEKTFLKLKALITIAPGRIADR
jgi:competence protein ComEA